MATITDVSKDLERLTVFISNLTPYSDDVLSKQIVGNWSIQDIISHIMGWDKNFIKTLDQIINNDEVKLEEHHDVQAFNEGSVIFGRKMKPHDLLKEAITQREQLILKLNMVSESAFIRQFHNSTYTLETFLQEMFIGHDKHHEEQIMKYLQTVK
ncbi:ClbS/DfsB family four-helix bundle protein [Paenibacillus sp. D2_2]|uniref:DinB family protein n=1 Tax=Paenibacillus sp. D2_2 TaxID=3073092 RepID=UPI0028166C5F|nr:DinB family protein [Paenibacillus sp. D2_2]WMT41860.1 ClbS/DfsB family four-helix bundle protein [Paenibacillus sp. D2_2]